MSRPGAATAQQESTSLGGLVGWDRGDGVQTEDRRGPPSHGSSTCVPRACTLTGQVLARCAGSCVGLGSLQGMWSVVWAVWAVWPSAGWQLGGPSPQFRRCSGPGPLSFAGSILRADGTQGPFYSLHNYEAFTSTRYPTYSALPDSTLAGMYRRVTGCPLASPWPSHLSKGASPNGLRGSAIFKWRSWSAPSLARRGY